MNARDQIKPKTIRLAILLALADGAIATIDDLQIRMDEPRARIASNVHPTAAEGLIKRLRDDVTSLPAYQITAKGREHLASFAGGKAEVAPTAEDSRVVEPVDEAALQHQKVLDAIAANNSPEHPAITPGVKVEITDRHEPTASAIICAMAFGYQGNNEPPAGHWLSEFHRRGAADAKKDAEIYSLHSRIAHMTLMLRNSSAYALAFEGPIELLLANILHKAAHQQSPVGYVVKRPGKTLSRFTKADSAQANAMVSARDGKRAQVFALVPAGVAVPGAEWVGA